MSADKLFLAIFTGSSTSPRRAAWDVMSEAEQREKGREGMMGWKAWVEKHQSSIVSLGGPLGKTKKVSAHGVEDISNHMSAYTVVRADSHEAAAKLFENHPHFAIFPGDGVEIMPVMPIPGG